MKMSHWMSVLALSTGMASMSFGQITGKVNATPTDKIPDMPEITAIKTVPDCARQHKDPVFEEKVVADDKGNLANVIVYIKSPEGKPLAGKTATEPAVLDQKGCMYVPHVLPIMVNQPLLVKNSDPFLHNVHTLSIDNAAFNMGMPNVGEKKVDPFTAPELFKVKCDVHPWMAAWIKVLDNPYFAATSSDDKSYGTYSIDAAALPDGDYTLVAWQEMWGEQEQKITLKDHKATANFTYDPTKKAQAMPFKELHLAAKDCCAARVVAANVAGK